MSLASRRFVVVIGAAFALGTATARAALECPAAVVQAGTVRSGAPFEHVFRLINRGPGTVEITGAETSCGCMTPRIDRRVLAPGEEATVAVAIRTLTQAAGPHTWQVRIGYTEDRRAGLLPLVLAGRVLSEITVQPPLLALSTSSSIAHVLTVTDSRPRSLTVTAVETSSPRLRAKLEGAQAGPDGRQACKVRVEVPPDCPEGRHAEVVHLHTDDATYPELEVPVIVTKRSAGVVRALPEAVTITAVPGEALPSRIVLLQTPDDREARIDRAEADDPAIECRWAAGPGPRSTLRVHVDRTRMNGTALRGSVRVYLASPAGQSVVIPVTALVR